jgi:hypothetical protein
VCEFYYSKALAKLAHASAPRTQGFSEGKGACVHVFYYSRALAHLAHARAHAGACVGTAHAKVSARRNVCKHARV